jgi:hypothetical protein
VLGKEGIRDAKPRGLATSVKDFTYNNLSRTCSHSGSYLHKTYCQLKCMDEVMNYF